ncbi:peptidase M14 carboxypeptidase A (plasmid) [Gemmatirosa kalamazoonensis]|uniref:Peptidase M14 carboxypeptidase A n=1 Tax=Gemmatirosa kalamazoonensis TaxID=861299 RepID=W0RW90_9BACT|nr:M14 family zinc carboxypeptidase [Gemmatirosa kalamazoonensis]AHG93843.1 peptidase M14 carboxypeptidase A [Gemmatirosa kalamazoonensis]
MRHPLSRTPWLAAALVAAAATAGAQSAQPIDQEYTAKIKQNLSDPRISTELVDHLPASATVPTPLKFLGHIVGQNGELDHAADIHRYLKAVADASNGRAKLWTIGRTEEGRDLVLMAIADPQTIARLDDYKGYLKALTDPRKTTEAQAQQLLGTAKPIYYITSGMHSPESGGPEMLMELAYRLVVEETPLVQNVRNNVITFITPVIEVDGREKMVDTYYWNKANRATVGNLPLMYWGKYVQHDNNRDGMGQFLELTKAVTRVQNEWTPTIMHDLHEAQTYLYASTGTGPYNDALDPITVDEWWMLAKNDVMEMTKRGVPGVWTYGFYDGWVPNYMFFIAHSHNATGRFYEVQSYGPDPYVVKPAATTTSREWFRPNPPLDSINWGPRANTNIQESAILFALNHVANNKHTYLENYWLKNKRAVAKAHTAGQITAWVIPADQHAKQNAAEAVNDLRTQGLEFHRATSAFQAGKVSVKPGDYIIRGDQPFRTIADMYFSLQNFSPTNPSPYDDTGWTFPLMRNLTIAEVTDPAILDAPMSPLPSAPVVAAGGVTGKGNTVVVDNTSDNALVSFRFKLRDVKMDAAEEGFDAAGRHFGPGAIVVRGARARIEPELKRLGLSGYAVASLPNGVKTHPLDVPRIGYVHSWTRTQDEGWWRAALDTYGVPYSYFGEPELKKGNLRAKYDVIIYPYGGTPLGNNAAAAGQFAAGAGGGGGPTSRGRDGGQVGTQPVPYKKTAQFPALGYPDSTDDVRGGVGADGFKALYEFVRAGGTLITEGNTAQNLVELKMTPGVTSEAGRGLFARGTILRGVVADRTSPLVYGYEYDELPVYFSSGPLFNASNLPAVQVAAGANATGRAGSVAQNTTPMATPLKLSPWDPARTGTAYGVASVTGPSAAAGRGGFGGGGGGGGGFGGQGAGGTPPDLGLAAEPNARPRVVLQFPAKADDMLLSGTLENGQLLANRAQLVDESLGKGHIVLFAIRPFWRWQTQGTYALGFNAILNWNDLDAGRGMPVTKEATSNTH